MTYDGPAIVIDIGRTVASRRGVLEDLLLRQPVMNGLDRLADDVVRCGGVIFKLNTPTGGILTAREFEIRLWKYASVSGWCMEIDSVPVMNRMNIQEDEVHNASVSDGKVKSRNGTGKFFA
ncbi:hypothetical protein Trydic_g14289 [Trypoxylus dichotomus]